MPAENAKQDATPTVVAREGDTAPVLRLERDVDLSAPEVRWNVRDSLEQGGVVVLLGSGFALTASEREVIANTRRMVTGIDDEDIRDGKPTIIYEPWHGRIKKRRYAHARGRLTRTDLAPEIQPVLESMMARFGTWAQALIDGLLPAYVGLLVQDRITYRPHERSALQPLHIDSSYGYPTRGRGMLRIFCNVDPSGRPRVWQVGEPFGPFVRRFLPSVRPRDPGWLESLASRLGITKDPRSSYDDVIAALRLLGKRDKEYQRTAPREIVEFPSGSCWLAITDLVLHGAVSGRHSLDQTFFLPAAGMARPERSSLHTLQKLLGRALA